MIPDNSDRQTPTRPSRDGVGGAQDIEETGSYPPSASWWPTAPVADGPSTSHERFDFLSSPRADGEFGWLAHYRVLRLLGQGGMGLVFLAEDSLLARHVALKVIRPEIADAPGIALRFTREARATAAIKHDHIVTIYQVGQENGVLFLAMELLTGLSLAQWLDRGQIPSVELVLRIGREIAAGLSAAHRHGLIHRDIKPANVWLEAPSGRVKILDFGMARSVREDVEITRSGVVMGTPAYMAPEQARGEPANAGSDLFSLGCVIYRLCTCRLPFEGESVMAVLTALSTTTPRRPRDWRNELPPALDELVSRLLAKDPADRPESAEVVVKEIRTIERALFAERQKAERLAATPFSADVEFIKPNPTQAAEKPSLPQAAARPRNRIRTIGIGAAVLSALMVAAVVGFVFAPARTSQVAMVAAGPTSAPANDDREVLRPFTTPKTDGVRTAQPVASPDRLSLRVDRGAASEPSPLTGLDVLQSKAAAEPALTLAPEDSQHVDPSAELVAPSVR
ncbi:MAG TPA: serine/threonine-protein kinase, partial [Isosphaeraceae bacterium]|nr:serine/threonine-protein kinase [Isosphaeraceae bacterium]